MVEVVELVGILEMVVMVDVMIYMVLFKEVLVKVAVVAVDLLNKILPSHPQVDLQMGHLIPHMVVEEEWEYMVKVLVVLLEQITNKIVVVVVDLVVLKG